MHMVEHLVLIEPQETENLRHDSPNLLLKLRAEDRLGTEAFLRHFSQLLGNHGCRLA